MLNVNVMMQKVADMVITRFQSLVAQYVSRSLSG